MPIEIPDLVPGDPPLSRQLAFDVESAIISVLEQTPPELYADIVNRGIYLAGGGGLLRGLDKRLTDKINIPFHIAEDPLHAVARGTGIALKNVDKFSFLLR
jgi:rod shape-determining protein MreB